MDTRQDNRSLGELFADLTTQMTMLVRQEVALAKTEVSAKVASMRRDLIMMVVGGLVAYAGFLALIALAIIAIAQALPLWLSALIVTVIVLGLGAGLMLYGLENLQHMDKVPRQTVQTLKEDAQWMKDQVS